MKNELLIGILIILFLFAGCQTPRTATNDTGTYSGETANNNQTPHWVQKVTDTLANTAAETLEDKLNDATNKYDGAITSATLELNTYDKIIFNVMYQNIGNPPKVIIGAEALKQGHILPEYYYQPIPLNTNAGTFQFVMHCPNNYRPDCQYNCSEETNNPEYINFFLYRTDDPGKKFGQMIIALNNHGQNKTETYSSETNYNQTNDNWNEESQPSSQEQQVSQSSSTNTYTIQGQGKPGKGWVLPSPKIPKSSSQKLPVNQTTSSSNVPTGTIAHTAKIPAIPTALSQKPKFEYSVDRPGMDIRSFEMSTADPAICRQECINNSACKAFTYVKPGIQGQRAKCWLKHSVPIAKKNDGCISGVVRP